MSHLGPRLSALIDGELSDPQRERALSHLARCEPCRQEAIALRLLKQRMHTLGDETTAGDALTQRLIGLAGPGDRRAPGDPPCRTGRRRRPVLVLAVAVAAVTLALSLPAAAFLAGGGQQVPGPRVTPAVDMFMVQHSITTGGVPVAPSPSPPGPSGTPGTAGPRWSHR